MVHIYCGDGKGKTTASVGLALRMAGAGKKVLFSQFFKNGSSSEIVALRSVPHVTLRHCKTVPGRFSRLSEEEKEQARADYTEFLRALLAEAGDYDLFVMDEIVSSCNWSIVPEEEVVEFLKEHREGMEIVLTGRDPSETLCQQADYITEMKKLRHPFDQGIRARFGVEY